MITEFLFNSEYLLMPSSFTIKHRTPFHLLFKIIFNSISFFSFSLFTSSCQSKPSFKLINTRTPRATSFFAHSRVTGKLYRQKVVSDSPHHGRATLPTRHINIRRGVDSICFHCLHPASKYCETPQPSLLPTRSAPPESHVN